MRIATDNRDVILQTAATLFARKAFHEVLMDEVAEKAGIAKGTIYRYFANKDELFAALSMSYMEMLGVEIGKSADVAGLPLIRLKAMLQRLAELVTEHRDFFQVMMRHECDLWEQKENEFSTRRGVIRDHFARVIDEAHARQEMNCPFDSRAAADMLLGMNRNLLRFTTPTPTPAQATEMMLHVFINGLKGSKTGGAR